MQFPRTPCVWQGQGLEACPGQARSPEPVFTVACQSHGPWMSVASHLRSRPRWTQRRCPQS